MAGEEDSFVSIGTAFDVPEEDAPKKKALPVHEQFATDNEGRRRFHGAFTGGFSAGYFNTVGSKEGWTPSTFLSSRSKRFDSSRQKPEDFMDEEDLGEFGIAPKNLETTHLFSREQQGREKRNESFASTLINLDSMMRSALENLVVPCRMSVGVRLLRKMGWKEGQGIGPRVRQLPKKKVYGCVRLPGTTENDKEDDEHDIYAEGLLFAPKDSTTIKFTPKDNVHGIGYKGMLAPTPHSTSKPGFSGSLKIKGQAFGVGAFEDDDEDVYAQDSISSYDIELREREPSHSNQRGWTGPPRQNVEGGALSLFRKASKPKPANKVFPPPSIPRGYQLFVNIKETYDIEKDEKVMTHLTSEARGKLLGEQPVQKPIKSVFDLMSKDDRDRIASTKKTFQTNSNALKHFSQQCSNVGGVGFQPFARDPAKQARYESFLESRKSGKESIVPKELCCGLTEWEREREKEEFTRAAMLYQPLKGDIAARFTRGKSIDDDVPDKTHCKSTKEETKSVEEKAAEMKMFGKLTRQIFEWHPAKLLCKRFNIPEPYPSSSRTGLVLEKKEKFTLGQLFETSQKNASDELTSINKTRNISDNSAATPSVKLIRENFNIDENIEFKATPNAVAIFEEQTSEKPPIDLFKAIFASSSEEESENSENEEVNNEQSTQLNQPALISNAGVVTSPKQQTKTSYYDENIFKGVSKVIVGDLSPGNQRTVIPEQKSNVKQHAMEVEEDEAEFGPRPPPKQTQSEESYIKQECQSLQTVPISRYGSNSESDSDAPRRKHKRKQKHKSKHKNKDKSIVKERSKKRGKDRLISNDRQLTSNSQNPKKSSDQAVKLKSKEIPDDKQILSKLKAVQKRRMCAADFM